jgi:inner membrane protein
MDPVTHGLTGALLAETRIGQRLGGWSTWLLAGVAMFPDIDIVYRIAGLPTYLENHRGLTHSFVGILGAGVLLGALFAKLDRSRRYLAWISACWVALFSHQALDLITSYGTIALYPFSRQRFYFDWIFIIDLFFTGIILLFLVLSRASPARAIRIARIGILVAIVYVGFCAVNHKIAMRRLEQTARDNKIAYESIAAIPQPFHALKWSGIIDAGNQYYQISFNNLKELNPKFQIFNKTTASLWERKARDSELGILYYWFARYPVVEEYVQDRYHVVEFSDLRFYIRVRSLPIRKPFVLRFKLDDAGNILESRFLRS